MGFTSNGETTKVFQRHLLNSFITTFASLSHSYIKASSKSKIIYFPKIFAITHSATGESAVEAQRCIYT